jgi:hypothetical protein
MASLITLEISGVDELKFIGQVIEVNSGRD